MEWVWSFNIYPRAIPPSELVDAKWTKDDKKENASPNLLKMSRVENRVSLDMLVVMLLSVVG